MIRKNILLVAALALAMQSCSGNKTDNAVSVNENAKEAIEAVAESEEVTDSAAVPVEEAPATPTYMLTKDGLGTLTLGMKKSDIPASIPGLYDSKKYNAFDHDYDMDIPTHLHGVMYFSLEGKPQFAITFDNNGKAVQISVQSPSIPTSLGITTASSVEKAGKLPGAKPAADGYIDGYEVSGFTIYASDKITSIAVGEQY